METSNPNLLSAAYKAVRRTDKSSLENLCKYWSSSEVENAIDNSGYTILHFIAFYGNSIAIKKLRDEKLLTKEQLIGMRDVHGDTALYVAARFGSLGVAKEILEEEKNSDSLISSVNISEDTPIYVAAASGQIKFFDFLTKKVPSEHVTKMKRTDEKSVLHIAIEGQFFDLAFRILGHYPELADGLGKRAITPLYLLACNKTSFRSGTMYNLTNLSSSSFIPWRIITILFYYLCFTPLHVSKSQTIGSTILAGYRKLLKAIPFFKEACEASEKHVYAFVLAQDLVKAQKQWPRYDLKEDLSTDPLIKAVKNSIMELVKLILNKFPEAATAVDENKRNILLMAAESKDTFMYEYLKSKVGDERKLLSEVDRYGNTALHLAAVRLEFSKNTYSPLWAMAWDVFWYQHVKQDIHLSLIRHRNLAGLTAKEIFKSTHIKESIEAQENTKKVLKDENTLITIANALENAMKSKGTVLIKEAEEDAKKVNEGLMLVAVLISTVNFAGIFTIPSGFSQESGIPLFFDEKHTTNNELNYFLIYIGVSLLASLIALGTQLSIHLSRFRKIDFYFVLPSKMFIATTALYYSTTFSISACFQAYILEEALEEKAFIGMIVASLPAALVYFDLVYYIMNYLYFPVWYKFLAGPRRVIHSSSQYDDVFRSILMFVLKFIITVSSVTGKLSIPSSPYDEI